jgi:NitT/TauT family transport system ATP-binding protein
VFADLPVGHSEDVRQCHVRAWDEPFASVDAQTRADLEDLLLRLRNRLNITIALVTHDIDEAVYLGDVVVVLGGSPTRVEARLRVGLGPDRDQILTKAEPEFLKIRAHVLAQIRAPRDSGSRASGCPVETGLPKGAQ